MKKVNEGGSGFQSREYTWHREEGREGEAARQTAERIISVIYVVVVTFVVIFGSSPLLLSSLHVTTKQQYFIPGEMLSVSQILCALVTFLLK